MSTNDCRLLKWIWQATAPRHALPSAIGAAFLLSACAQNNVVTEVAVLPNVPTKLMAAPGIPRCVLPDRQEYDAIEVLAYAKCYEAAYHALSRRLIGLQRAVSVREASAAKAVKASKL